uniref:Bifunctional inhibitor/plant lipid transfer protein/seed storage helical domain-containing protein n=1 Tax=Arundo donax TaxID=35708 RepID=A0A0A9EMG9_ARUDO
MRGIVVLVALVVAVTAAGLAAGHGAGECGATPPDKMALKLAPCASAAQDPKSAPSSGCCNAVHTIGKQSPACLCAVMLSNTAKSSGIKPEVAITIPKRCNLVDRPVGYKCGGKRATATWLPRLPLLLPILVLHFLLQPFGELSVVSAECINQ